LLSRPQMGLRKRLPCRAASSSRSDDSSDAKGSRTNAARAMGRATGADSASRGAKRAAAHKATQDAVFQRRLPDSAEDYDRLSGQQAPEEEAQVAAGSDFLSFVPFQILKRIKQHSREIICIALKAKFPLQCQPRRLTDYPLS
jgi:hypothetical protein